jgi:hypothetical protein
VLILAASGFARSALVKVAVDYFSLNKKRILSDLAIIYGCFLLAVLAKSGFSTTSLLLGPLFVLAVAVPVVGLSHVVAAYLIVWTAARESGVSMISYILSQTYDAEGRRRLRRGPGRPWF